MGDLGEVCEMREGRETTEVESEGWEKGEGERGGGLEQERDGEMVEGELQHVREVGELCEPGELCEAGECVKK